MSKYVTPSANKDQMTALQQLTSLTHVSDLESKEFADVIVAAGNAHVVNSDWYQITAKGIQVLLEMGYMKAPAAAPSPDKKK